MKPAPALPPYGRWPAWTGLPPTDGGDRKWPFRLLACCVHGACRLDTLALPPWSGSTPCPHAPDPLRALRVLPPCRMLRFRSKLAVVNIGMPHWHLRRLVRDRVVPRADAALVCISYQAAEIGAAWPGIRRA